MVSAIAPTSKTLPIISTPHACENLSLRGHTALYPMKAWETIRISTDGDEGGTELVLTSMPGKHTLGGSEAADKVMSLIPPVMGSMVTFRKAGGEGFSLYISGDTLYYDELKVSYFDDPTTLVCLFPTFFRPAGNPHAIP